MKIQTVADLIEALNGFDPQTPLQITGAEGMAYAWIAVGGTLDRHGDLEGGAEITSELGCGEATDDAP